MEKLLDSISGFVDEKLKNPFINTFLISWLAFNWRPIMFFIFSKETAETRIWFITTNYSNLKTILVYPVLWTIAILVIIPLLLLGVEYILSFITKYRRDLQKADKIKDIARQGKIAEEKNKTDELVLAASKVGNVNLYIAELNEKIALYEKELSDERTKNLELVKSHQIEIQHLENIKETQANRIKDFSEMQYTLKQNHENQTNILKTQLRNTQGQLNTKTDENEFLSNKITELQKSLAEKVLIIKGFENDKS